MARKTEAYVDTSALIAFVDRSDTYHTLFKRLFSDPPPLITTSLVVSEGHGWFLKRYDRTKGIEFLNLIESLKPMRITSFGSEQLKRVGEILRKFKDQDLTLTDAAGLEIMERQKIKSCWSTDFHLGLTGVQLVIHQY